MLDGARTAAERVEAEEKAARERLAGLETTATERKVLLQVAEDAVAALRLALAEAREAATDEALTAGRVAAAAGAERAAAEAAAARATLDGESPERVRTAPRQRGGRPATGRSSPSGRPRTSACRSRRASGTTARTAWPSSATRRSRFATRPNVSSPRTAPAPGPGSSCSRRCAGTASRPTGRTSVRSATGSSRWGASCSASRCAST